APAPGHRPRPARRGRGVGPRLGRAQARAARLPVERPRDSALRALRVRARGLPETPLRPGRPGGRRDPHGLQRRPPRLGDDCTGGGATPRPRASGNGRLRCQHWGTMISLLARFTLLPAARAVGWLLIEVAVPLLVLVFVLGFRLVVAVRGSRPAERR